MDLSTEGSKSRVFWLDIARFIAIISITMNHAVNRTLNLEKLLDNFSFDLIDFDILLRTGIYIFSRLGVPIFFMITGALILNKNFTTFEDVKYFYKNNLLKIFITSEIWLGIMYFFIIFLDMPGYEKLYGLGPKVEWFFRTLFFDSRYTYGNIWYIPVILAIYTILPCFAIVIKKVSIKALELPLLVVLVFGFIVPNIDDTLFLIDENMYLYSSVNYANIFSIYMPYLIIGYMIRDGLLDKFSCSKIIFGTVSMLLITIMYTFWYAEHESYFDVSYYSIFVVLLSALIFEIIRRLGRYFDDADLSKNFKLISYISKISFAIYFIHIIIMEYIRFNIVSISDSDIIDFVFYDVASVILSILIIYVLSNVKILKKYLFMLKD